MGRPQPHVQHRHQEVSRYVIFRLLLVPLLISIVYMLTGEYDWSNTPAMGQATCDKITGGKHQAMKGVGHFPATENPKVFVGYRKSLNVLLRSVVKVAATFSSG